MRDRIPSAGGPSAGARAIVSDPARPPRVVAELGRPETPEETAARRAENSRLHRTRQTVRNLVASLLVTVGIVVVIVAFVPHSPGGANTASVDYASAAAQAEATAGQPLLAPRVPSTWRANAAQLRSSKGVASWYVGFVTPDDGFAAFSEGIDADSTWLDDLLASAPRGGTTTIAGLPWRVYDQRALGQAAGNIGYALVTRIGTTYVAVYGTAAAADERSLAAALADAARARHLTGTAVAA